MISIVTDKNQLVINCAPPDITKSLPIMIEAYNWVKENSNALGLAAPQIGVHESWFVMKNPSGSWMEDKIIIVVNPIMKLLGKQKTLREACFSAPGETYEVSRNESVSSKFIKVSLNGIAIKCSMVFNGVSAQIFQHEYDHIKGRCIFHKGEKV